MVALLLGAPVRAAPAADLWEFWLAHDDANDRRVDHAPWQRLLDGYLVATSDGRTLFRYGAVTPADRAALDAYLDELDHLDPRELARAEQLPYWLDLYNALTVRVVLDNPDKDSIRRMGGSLFRVGPWDDELANIAGRPVTLNDIEHRILRPIWHDRRIHYAVNCASLGCPNLARWAFTRGNVEALLAEAEVAYLSHPRGVEFDSRGTLWLSSLFDWYVADFGADRPALLAYLSRTLAPVQPTLAARLDGFTGRTRYRYDWSLNRAD